MTASAARLLEAAAATWDGTFPTFAAAARPPLVDWAMARTRGWHAPDPEDVVQRILVRAWSGWHAAGIEAPRQASAWTWRIARNLLVDEARRAIVRARHRRDLVGDGADDGDEWARLDNAVVDPQDVASQVEAADEARRLLRVLAAERGGDTLVRFACGASYVEIASQDGVAVTAVKSRLNRLRRRLAGKEGIDAVA